MHYVGVPKYVWIRIYGLQHLLLRSGWPRGQQCLRFHHDPIRTRLSGYACCLDLHGTLWTANTVHCGTQHLTCDSSRDWRTGLHFLQVCVLGRRFTTPRLHSSIRLHCRTCLLRHRGRDFINSSPPKDHRSCPRHIQPLQHPQQFALAVAAQLVGVELGRQGRTILGWNHAALYHLVYLPSARIERQNLC